MLPRFSGALSLTVCLRGREKRREREKGRQSLSPIQTPERTVMLHSLHPNIGTAGNPGTFTSGGQKGGLAGKSKQCSNNSSSPSCKNNPLAVPLLEVPERERISGPGKKGLLLVIYDISRQLYSYTRRFDAACAVDR